MQETGHTVFTHSVVVPSLSLSTVLLLIFRLEKIQYTKAEDSSQTSFQEGRPKGQTGAKFWAQLPQKIRSAECPQYTVSVFANP